MHQNAVNKGFSSRKIISKKGVRNMSKGARRWGKRKKAPTMPETKIHKNYKFAPEVVEALEKQAESSGRTATRVLEDLVMRRDKLSKTAQELIARKVQETGWTHDEAIEWAVIRCLSAQHINGNKGKPPIKKKR